MSFKIPPSYLGGLSPADARKQESLIKKSRRRYSESGVVFDRPRVSEAPTPRSPHVIRFQRRYGFPITDKMRVSATFPDTNTEGILAKGAAAYASSGSRPNVSVYQWKMARLASVLTGGPSLRIDKDLVGPISMKRIVG
jgi:hypothetical protein